MFYVTRSHYGKLRFLSIEGILQQDGTGFSITRASWRESRSIATRYDTRDKAQQICDKFPESFVTLFEKKD